MVSFQPMLKVDHKVYLIRLIKRVKVLRLRDVLSVDLIYYLPGHQRVRASKQVVMERKRRGGNRKMLINTNAEKYFVLGSTRCDGLISSIMTAFKGPTVCGVGSLRRLTYGNVCRTRCISSVSYHTSRRPCRGATLPVS